MPLSVIKQTVGPFEENCYIVFDPQGKEGIIIDPGDASDFIAQTVSEKEIRIKSIIATHGHSDHTSAIFELQLLLNVPFYMNPKDKFLLPKGKFGNNPVIKPLKEGDKIKVGRYSLKVSEVPGHTPGSVFLYDNKSNLIFVGDVIFSDGSLGRYDFYYSRKEILFKSVANILKLPGTLRVYSGHGEEGELGEIKALLKDEISV